MPVNGLVVMTPTSIASTGTGNSSSINADGSVDFASCSTLSLNGVFTSSYDNYMISLRGESSSATGVYIRLRASGTDASSSNYTSQQVYAGGSSISATRSTNVFAAFGGLYAVQRGGVQAYVFGPYLAQPTVIRVKTASDYASAEYEDAAGIHPLSTSYDGFTLVQTYPITGLLTVFAFNQ